MTFAPQEEGREAPAEVGEDKVRQRKQRAPKPMAGSGIQAAETRPSGAGAVEISVILPVTASDGRVREVVEALGAELTRLGRAHEFLLVFDGVRGRAWSEAVQLAAERPGQVVPIAFEQVFGESACLAAGYERARGSILVTTPQYVQVDPYELAPMLAALDAGADFVAPWRHPRVDPYLNRLQSAMFNAVMRRILHGEFHDLNCWFRVFRKDVLAGRAIYGDMYRFLPAIVARQGFKVVEVRVRHLREWGRSSFFGFGVYVRRALDILGVVFLSKFTLRPLRFFGMVGLLFLLFGGLLCTAIVVQRVVLGEGGVFSRPLFQFGMLLFVLGVQVIGFGLVGEIIIYAQARNLREYRVERVFESGGERDDHERGGPGA